MEKAIIDFKVVCLRATLSIACMSFCVILCLNFFATIPSVSAQQIVFSDDFTKDTSLSGRWVANGNLGVIVWQAVKGVLVNTYNLPDFYLIDPTPSFSSNGMCISSVNDPITMTTIESIDSFTAPFTLRAQVVASKGGGAAFCLWLNGQVGFNAILNASGSKYGIWSDITHQWFNQRIVAAPEVNTIYDLTMDVSSNGLTTLNVSSSGKVLGSVVEQALDNPGSVKILLGQYEVYDDTGRGPNQAYWKSITITTPQVTTSTTSHATTNAISPTPTNEQPQTSPSISPTPSSSSTIQPTTTPLTPTNGTVTQIIQTSYLSLSTLIVLVIGITAPLVLLAAFLVFRRRKQPSLNQELLKTEKPSAPRFAKFWIMVPLFIASTGAAVTNGIINVFATDIAREFYGTPTSAAIGAVGQLSTINTIADVVVAILLSILVIKFKHKPLFIVGIVLITTSAIGSYFSNSLLMLQFFYALEGAGTVVIAILSALLIAETLPVENRGKAMSILLASGAAIAMVVTPIAGFVVASSGWRAGIIMLVLPISLIGLLASMFMLPMHQLPKSSTKTPNVNPYVESLKGIFTNKSATACLVASLFTVPGTSIAIFALAFYRNHFSVPSTTTVIIYEAAIVLGFFAYLTAGPFIDKFGPRRIAGIGLFLSASLTATFFFIPNFSLALIVDMSHVWFGAMSTTAFACLTLEQVPKYRGSLFSINHTLNGAGQALAPMIGGAMLVMFGVYSAAGVALGIMTMIGCILVVFMVRDRISKEPIQQKSHS